MLVLLNASSLPSLEHAITMQHRGRVVTATVLASLVGEAWPLAFTPLNILSGFRKCGIQPFTPSEVSDRQSGPSNGVTQSPNPQQDTHCQESPPFSPALFEKRYREGYNVDDDEYKVCTILSQFAVYLQTF